MENQMEPLDVTELKTPLPSSDVAEPLVVKYRENLLPPSFDDLMRFLLVIATIILLFAALFIYMRTGDKFILGTTTIIVLAVNPVYRYFFPKKR